MDIHSKEMTKIIQEIADKNNIKFVIAKRIIMSQFECVRATMKKVDSYNDFFPYIKLFHLFTFKVNPKRRAYFIQKAKRIVADVYTQTEQTGD